jgi:hypothetical protein
MVRAGSNGKTGGFSFVPGGPVFRGQPFTTLTSAQTQFRGITDLNSLSMQPPAVFKGLLYFEQRPGLRNRVEWTPPPV